MNADVAAVIAAGDQHYRATVARWRAEDAAWHAGPNDQPTNTTTEEAA